MSQSNVLTDLLTSLGLLGGSGGTATADMTALLEQWTVFFDPNGTSDLPPDQVAVWSAELQSLLNSPDRQKELAIVKKACEDPRLGLTLILSALPGVAQRQAQRWMDMAFGEQTDGTFLAGWKTKTLPAPGPGQKYLIVSDVHRDAAIDYKGFLATGSIDHFRKNAQLFQRILDYAIEGGYTVLENGDGEELWFVGELQDYPKKADGSLDIAAKLQLIINTHPNIYSRLRLLHSQGRYFRIHGNHDGFIRPSGNDHSVWDVLKTEMEKGVTVPFEMYDACLIDGVKTMMDRVLYDALLDSAHFAMGQLTPQQYLEKLLGGHLGLDAAPYQDQCRMLVTHGHQFDFWNSPDNEILGLLISNTVVTFVDRKMDPFLDLGGVAWEGNPVVQFGDLFADWLVFSSWPEKTAAIRIAHQIQHMPNRDRVLRDNIMYYESVAALFGSYGFGLSSKDPATGQEITPAQSRATLNLTSPLDIVEYLKRHHFHHICIGHTHLPHSQPYFTLDNISSVVLPLAPVMYLIKLLLPDFLEPRIKSLYSNSGTTGWMEGVVWAIQIDETGQSRLVFWTENSTGPESMDWELQPLSDAVRNQILTAAATVLKAPFVSIEQSVKDLYNLLKQRLADMNITPESMKEALANASTLPIYVLALALMTKPEVLEQSRRTTGLRQLLEVSDKLKKDLGDKLKNIVGESVEALHKQYDQLRSFTLDVMLSIKRRTFSGFTSTSPTEILGIRAPISPATRDKLLLFQRILKRMNMSEGAALHYAALALSAFDEFPRNLPFFNSMAEPLNPGARLHDAEAPVLQALLGTLWMYPPSGQTVVVQGVAIQSEFTLGDSSVTLTVTLSKANPPIV